VLEPRTELAGSGELAGHLLNLLTSWHNANGSTLPAVVVFYRDGVSDAELRAVREREVADIRTAFQEVRGG
jgi:hypothetical protein